MNICRIGFTVKASVLLLAVLLFAPLGYQSFAEGTQGEVRGEEASGELSSGILIDRWAYTKTYSVSEFSRIRICSTGDVVVRPSWRCRVRLFSDNREVQGRLIVFVENGLLIVKMDDLPCGEDGDTEVTGWDRFQRIDDKMGMQLEVELPVLDALEARGLCDVDIEGSFRFGPKMEIVTSGSVEVEFKRKMRLEGSLLVEATGSSEIDFENVIAPKGVTINCAGSSEVSLEDLTVNDGDIHCACYGSSEISFEKVNCLNMDFTAAGKSKGEMDDLRASGNVKFITSGESTITAKKHNVIGEFTR